MAQHQAKPALDKVDPVWARIRREAEDIVRREPELATFIYSTVLHHDTLEAAWSIGWPAASTMPPSRRIDPAGLRGRDRGRSRDRRSVPRRSHGDGRIAIRRPIG